MRFDPVICDECPFRRRGKRAVRLTAGRVREVAGNMLDVDGQTFSCHKEAHGESDDGGYHPSVDDRHCAGAIVFALRNRVMTAKMQIAQRFGLFDPDQFRSARLRRLVFATVKEMLTTALPGRR